VSRGGRYRVVRVAMWSEPSFQKLSADARLLDLALRTGSCSTFAGINVFYAEQLERDTGLTPGEIRNAFTELDKAGRIARDASVVWVRDQLESDPAIEKAGGSPNEDQRKGIETHLGTLPSDSVVVRKFRRYYHFTRRTVPPDGGGDGRRHRRKDGAMSPDSLHPSPSNLQPSPDSGDARAREKQDQPPPARLEGAPSAGSDNGILEREAEEIRLYGRTLGPLERNGRQSLPARVDRRRG